MQLRVLWLAIAMIAAGCGSSDEGRAKTSNSVRAGSGASGWGGSGGGLAGTGAPAPAAGTQLAQCSRDSDCSGGLTCYTYGRYCSKPCATDAECASLGPAYTCYVPPRFGGMMGQAGTTGAPAAPTGNCRLECQGPSDTSCPAGLMCLDVGGGFGMGQPTYRCGYPRMGSAPGLPGGAGMGGASGAGG